MRIFKKINKSNIKNKLKTNDKNIKIIKFLLLIGKIHCLVSLPHVTFLIFFNESRVVNVLAFICLILNTIIAIDIHNMELDIAENKKERNMI